MHTRSGTRAGCGHGVKLANHELTVIATGGDGDGFVSAATISRNHAPQRGI